MCHNVTCSTVRSVPEGAQGPTMWSGQCGPAGTWHPGKPHLLADLAGDIRLQPAREDLVNNAVAVVGVAGLLPIVITWGETGAL